MREEIDSQAEFAPPSSLPMDRLTKATLLAMELESLLLPVEGKGGDEINFRLRLARAEALGVVDILTDLVRKLEGPRSAVSRSGVYLASTAPGDGKESIRSQGSSGASRSALVGPAPGVARTGPI